MDVAVVMVAFAVFLANLIVEHPSSVFEGVYHVVFQEEGERAEDARLVHRHHQSLQMAEAKRVVGSSQCPQNQDAVGCGADALGFQMVDNFL